MQLTNHWVWIACA